MGKLAIKIGKSNIGDPKLAGKEAAQRALKQLEGSDPSFALIFATTGYDQKQLLKSIHQVLGDVPSAGCSGEGVITREGSDESSFAVAVMLFSGDKLDLNSYIAKDLKKSSYDCGKELAKEVNSKCKCKCKGKKPILFIFPDSMTANSTEIIKALEDNLKKPTVLLGGTAGDMLQFKKTYQYHDGKVYTDAISAVCISGDYEIDWLVSHGCEEIGLEQVATKTSKNLLMEIDDKPAWNIFKEYLPGNPDVLKAEDAFHLCLGELHRFKHPNKDQLIIRMPVKLIQETGAVQFSVEIPEGTDIRLTRRDPKVIAKKVLSAFSALLKKHKGKKPIAVFQFDCAGRGRVIFGNELNCLVMEPLQKMLKSDVPWIGFHTYGEFSPLCGKVFFHNFTAVIAVLFEK